MECYTKADSGITH